MAVALVMSCLLFSAVVFAADGTVTKTLEDGTVVVAETVTAEDGSVVVTETSYVNGVAVKQTITQKAVVEEVVQNDDGTTSTRATETVTVTTYTPNADGTTTKEVSGNVTVSLISPDGDTVIESSTDLATQSDTLAQPIDAIAAENATPPEFPGQPQPQEPGGSSVQPQGFDNEDTPDIQDTITIEDAEAGSPT